MPLKTAFRNTFLRPIASSSPGGQTAKISQSNTAIAISTISAQAGWRSMNRLMPATRPSGGRADRSDMLRDWRQFPPSLSSRAQRPLQSADGSRALGHPSDAARGGLDRQYLFTAPVRAV